MKFYLFVYYVMMFDGSPPRPDSWMGNSHYTNLGVRQILHLGLPGTIICFKETKNSLNKGKKNIFLPFSKYFQLLLKGRAFQVG